MLKEPLMLNINQEKNSVLLIRHPVTNAEITELPGFEFS